MLPAARAESYQSRALRKKTNKAGILCQLDSQVDARIYCSGEGDVRQIDQGIGMKASKTLALLSALFTALITTGHSSPAQAQTSSTSSVSGTITQAGAVHKGTPEYEMIRQFVLNHPGKFDSFTNTLADLRTAPESIQVTTTRSITSYDDLAHVMAAPIPGPTPAPPVPLPTGNFQVGNTYTIYVAGPRGHTQTWGYTYESVGQQQEATWELTSYTVVPTPKGPNRPIGNQ